MAILLNLVKSCVCMVTWGMTDPGEVWDFLEDPASSDAAMVGQVVRCLYGNLGVTDPGGVWDFLEDPASSDAAMVGQVVRCLYGNLGDDGPRGSMGLPRRSGLIRCRNGRSSS